MIIIIVLLIIVKKKTETLASKTADCEFESVLSGSFIKFIKYLTLSFFFNYPEEVKASYC